MHTLLILIKTSCDAGCKVSYDEGKCKFYFRNTIGQIENRDRNTSKNMLEEKPPCQPTRSRAALASAISDISDCLNDVSTGDKNMNKYMALYKSIIGLQNNNR